MFAGVHVAVDSGAHLDPAVTVGPLAHGDPGPSAAGAATSQRSCSTRSRARCSPGSRTRSTSHFHDHGAEPAEKLGVLSTAPRGIPSLGWTLVTGALGLFVPGCPVVAVGSTPSGLGPLPVARIVVGMGGNAWAHAWVPVVGPLIGGTLGGALAAAVDYPAA